MRARAESAPARAYEEEVERARILLSLARADADGERDLVSASAAVVCELLREACYWALRAIHGKLDATPSLEELWARTEPSLIERLPDAIDSRPTWEKYLLGQSFVSYAALGAAEQRQAAKELERLARGLLEVAAAPLERVQRLRAERFSRIVLPLLVAVALCTLLLPLVRERLESTRNLAAGRPWRASSEFARCDPQARRCGSMANVGIFVHTKLEDSPWVEFDLGGAREFSQVTIKNRSDCCDERALPLVIEVSKDRKRWREVARRGEPFFEWRARFQKTSARYVRARVDNKSYLHLEEFRVQD